jgi:hypothetical protein
MSKRLPPLNALRVFDAAAAILASLAPPMSFL